MKLSSMELWTHICISLANQRETFFTSERKFGHEVVIIININLPDNIDGWKIDFGKNMQVMKSDSGDFMSVQTTI